MSEVETTIRGIDAEVGKKYRILMQYNEEHHILLHLQVMKDASLYTSSAGKKIRHEQFLIKQVDTQTTIDFTQGKVIDESKGAHLSFHGSGIVNTCNGRTYGIELRKLTKPGVICNMLFPHLSNLPVARELRYSDVTVNYPIDEDSPLSLNICVTPRGSVPSGGWFDVPRAAFQRAYFFSYDHLLEKDHLLLILIFHHSPGEFSRALRTFYPTYSGPWG